MDAFIYALVLVPALTELLPASGIDADAREHRLLGQHPLRDVPARVGPVDGLGVIGDRIGRVRALMLTILAYSLFTFLCGLVTNIWQLMVLRVLCGIGLGGEQPIGSTFVAEELPEDRRVKMAAGILHTGYYVGFLLASMANYFIGANYGWRWMFVFGGLPALFIALIRSGVKESRLWHEEFGEKTEAADDEGVRSARCSRRKYKNRTTSCRSCIIVSIIGQWAGSIYVPTAITQIALREGVDRPPTRRASRPTASMVLADRHGASGACCAPILAERFGRRVAMAHVPVAALPSPRRSRSAGRSTCR